MSSEAPVSSTRPYLIRALHEWCADNGLSPYIAVQVDASVQVPMEFVKNGEIVLDVSMDATSGLRLGNEYIEFKARFAGVAREIIIPVSHVIAIYARENGQGMAFPAPPPAPATPVALQPATTPPLAVAVESNTDEPSDPSDPGPDRPAGRPQLKRVK
ncbi:ClpXP protease specificity-enhancing factor [uncultured Hydrogenophaga sp.]|uniref:ClpXP protease specificity-enhancing factor n=1 Tax=uncultured Hydrogenophaga sp. TaxID=199683 RepID=UPI00265E6D1A|nr:ClpXP protease specificity-enhancing factor [uncultured Hydrogenophaga sp.]